MRLVVSSNSQRGNSLRELRGLAWLARVGAEPGWSQTASGCGLTEKLIDDFVLRSPQVSGNLADDAREGAYFQLPMGRDGYMVLAIGSRSQANVASCLSGDLIAESGEIFCEMFS